MPIHRLAKVVLLAPAIGSALIGIFGLLLGVALVLGHQSENRKHAVATQREIPAAGEITSLAVKIANQSDGMGNPAAKLSLKPNEATLKPANLSGRPKSSRSVSFAKPVVGARIGLLSEYAGKPANDLVREREFRDLVSKVVPYAPFHLGLDMPLPNAIESMFSVSASPLEIRDGKYAMLTGVRGSGGRGRAFLWADIQKGIALAGIFFYPSNGEPSPALTIFSRQVDQQPLGISQFPAAFVQDLSRWEQAEGVPPVTTRYFINSSGEKTVLVHDEDYCSKRPGMAPPATDVCKQMNTNARTIDKEAATFLNQTHYASNATMHMIADQSSLDGHVAPMTASSYH